MSLSISKEMLTPVIEQQVKAMMATILGGQEQIVDKVINQILTTKVGTDGKPSSYSNRSYFEWLLKEELTKAVKELIVEEIKSKTGNIKKAIRKQIQTESGSSLIANALLNGLNETLKNSWRSTFKIELQQTKEDE